MFRVVLCGCTASKSIIETRILDFFGSSKQNHEILEFESIGEFLATQKDFDVCFFNESMWSEMPQLLEYVKENLEEKMRVWAGIEDAISEESLERLTSFLSKHFNYQPMYLKLEFLTDRGVRNISVQDIRYFEFLDRKVKIHTVEGAYLTNDALKNVWNLVQSHGFYQIHKSIIVNMKHIHSVKNYVIAMKDGSDLPLAQKKSKDFRAAWTEFLQK